MPSAHKRKVSRIYSDDEEDDENASGVTRRPPQLKKELREALRKLADITYQSDTAPKRGRKKLKTAAGPLTPRGTETGINWQADLEKYIKYLQNGLDKRKASVLRIFREWDNIFFPDTDSSLAANGNGGDEAEKQLQDAMDLLDADEEEVPAEA
ncbi:hypothetical protein B0H13DRAFT_2369520 [Mycena leptocephala]|nr:hypothetical protein B0H13DRAFT_2369520 [Mycena leptocephala]